MANNEYLNKSFLDNYGTNWLFDILTPNTGSITFNSITPESIELNDQIDILPAWNNGINILNSVYTSSEQTEDGFENYTINVYSDNICDVSSKQFTIEYGHGMGYGSAQEYITPKTPTAAIYKKYKMLLDDTSLTDEYTHFFALKFHKIESQDSLYSDFFSIKLTNPVTSSNYVSLVNYDYFINQSSYLVSEPDAVRLVSGSLESGVYLENGSPVFYGKIYPKHSVAILNPDTLNQYINLNIQTGSNINEQNALKMYNSISQSINSMNSGMYSYWSLINVKKVRKILSMPIRILANSFNYSSNPSFYDGNGKIKLYQFIENPTVFFTSIGLYNDKYELLAIAKISRPLKKTFDEQYSFQVNIEIK